MDNLKKIAEYMGYEVRLSESNKTFNYGELGIWIVKKPPYMTGCFSLSRNNDQLVELIEKLFDYRKHAAVTGGDGIWVAEGVWKVQVYKDGYVAEAETLAEAVIKAAVNIIDGENHE